MFVTASRLKGSINFDTMLHVGGEAVLDQKKKITEEISQGIASYEYSSLSRAKAMGLV